MTRRLTEAEFYAAVPAVFGSPIEERLASALMEVAWEVGARVSFAAQDWTWERDPSGRRWREMVSICAQPQIEGLRPDFAVLAFVAVAPGQAKSVELLVECDGHDFHDRTKEQAQRDRRRDRKLARAGHTVLRYTGAEIHRDSIACASDVLGTLLERMRPLLEERDANLLREATGEMPDAGAW